MQNPLFRAGAVSRWAWALVALAWMAAPSPALGQLRAPDNGGIGERYFIEFSYRWWQPGVTGGLASSSLDAIGSQVNFASDLGLQRSSSGKINDAMLILRPSKRNRIRIQYNPNEFSGSNSLERSVNFSGQVFPVALLVDTFLHWKVLRIGYEYDFIYTSRGFIGIITEGGLTQVEAAVSSASNSASNSTGNSIGTGAATASATSPLVAIGGIMRVYPSRRLAITVEATGVRLTRLLQYDSLLKTMGLDVSATYNLNNYMGVSAGWRRADTGVQMSGDSGQMNLRGLWFGGVVRY